MKTSIVTVSYDKDLEWLKYSYKSIQKFCKEYHSYHVILDDHENDCVNCMQFCKDNNIKFHIDTNAKNIQSGYVRQQYMKLMADVYVPDDCDLICHVDSDSIFHDFHDPSIYFCKESNKPAMLMTPYSAFGGMLDHWLKSTSDFMQETVEYEFMRRMPLIYPKWLFFELRNWVLDKHKVSLLDYLKGLDTFSEYNALGAYCYKYHRNFYKWVDTTKDSFINLPFLQSWSHGSISEKSALIDSLIDNPEIHTLLKNVLFSIHNHLPDSNITSEDNIDYRDEKVLMLRKMLLHIIK